MGNIVESDRAMAMILDKQDNNRPLIDLQERRAVTRIELCGACKKLCENQRPCNVFRVDRCPLVLIKEYMI